MSVLAPLLGVGISAVGSLFSGISAKKEKEAAENELAQQQKTLDEWYELKSNQSYLDTDSAKGVLSYLNRQNIASDQAMQNNLISSGATAAERVAKAAALNEEYANTISTLAQKTTDYQNNIDSTYLKENKALSDSRIATNLENASAIGSIADISSAIGSSITTLSGF